MSSNIQAIRCSFITQSLSSGASVKDVQDIAGHATPTMTMNVYAKVQDEGKRQAVNSVNKTLNITQDSRKRKS